MTLPWALKIFMSIFNTFLMIYLPNNWSINQEINCQINYYYIIILLLLLINYEKNIHCSPRGSYLSWLLASCGYCGPQVDVGFPGSYRLRDAWGEGWSGDYNPSLSWVGGLWESSSLSTGCWARARHLCWVACWGCNSHGSSLVWDLVHNGLHELRGQSWEVDRCHSWIQREVWPEK